MTSDETKSTYAKWFSFADSDNDGRLRGDDAVKFFERSGLTRDLLAQVWALSDRKKEGFLSLDRFQTAMELISMAQNGSPLTIEAHEKAMESGIALPSMEGMAQITEDLKVKSVVQKSSFTPTVTAVMSAREWKNAQRHKKAGAGVLCTSVQDGLKRIYFEKVRPLEEMFKFGSFFSPLLNESDFEAKPSILLLGQYSTGKTTFIEHLLGCQYPGAHIGPEPTTDRFVVVNHGYEERTTPGNTLIVQTDKPYQGLQIFGTGFMTRFQSSQCPAQLLSEITLIDTPGVLSGEKQRIERQYDFVGVCEWFASRCDLILLLFDPYKLDISDEFKQIINALKGHDDKVRVVLNKADQTTHQQLMRVYGALMWSLSKVFRSPEVCRVYIGSFNSNREISIDKNPNGKELFMAEQEDLLNDLYDIPLKSCDRKVNEFVKRLRAFKIHMLIIGELRKQMPSMFGKKSASNKVMSSLHEHFDAVRRENHLPAGDFPDVSRFRDILSGYDLSAFPRIDKRMVKTVDDVLSVEIPQLIKCFDNPYG
eukprot:g6164.t1